MPIRTWVGRFCVADGRVDEEGPWLTSLVRQRPDEEADELYVLVEPLAPGAEEYAAQLVDVVARLYARDPLSLTGALTRSLRAAHDHLREWNAKSLPEHRVGAGASCLAVRGTDVYVAQAGPSLAYVRRATGEVRRLHAEPDDHAHALGIAEEFEPRLRRVAIEPGDLVLIASTQLDAVIPREHLERVLAREADDVLPELYLLCRDRAQFALVLLSCFLEAESEQPPDFLTRDGARVAAATAAGDDDDDQAAAEASAVLVEAPAARQLTAEAEASVAAGAMAGVAPAPPVHEQVRDITRSTAPPPATHLRLRGESAKPTYKRTTGIVPVPQLRIPKLAIFGVLALALIGVLAYAYLPGSVQESRNAKFERLVAQAREANARAQATGDGALKRQLLGDARTRIVDAEAIRGDDPDVASLKSDITAALAVLDAVFEVKDVSTVANLAQSVTGSLSVTRQVAGGGSSYLLDAKGRRVLSVPIDGSAAPATVLQQGQAVSDVTAGAPEYIAWSEQTRSLIILDDQRHAFAWFPASAGVLPINVRAIGELGSIDAVAASGGNLYILDRQQNQVWRYLPGEGGFDSERTALLDGAELGDATEIAVGQDIYALDAKKGVRRFVGKSEAAFPLAGIDTPLSSPASIAVLSGSNRIVIADRGNKRIILASADGTFIRQLKSPSFTDLRAVSVDEGANTMYVLNGDTLLKAPFPP